jgi:hypothetical protein
MAVCAGPEPWRSGVADPVNGASKPVVSVVVWVVEDRD